MDSDFFDEHNRNMPRNDVFLNYVMEDIGTSFVSHLKRGLKLSGFTICDHTMLPIGEDETSEHLKAIEDSEIFVAIFSKNYPFSMKCLDELVLIMDCLRKFKKRKVFPIFFNVDPTHVRSQEEGFFIKAFKEHQTKADPKRVWKWRQALRDVGHLCGLSFQNRFDEAEFVLKIIKEIENMQSPQELYVTDNHVGIGSRAQELISKLRLDHKDCVLVIAVFGISGIGKTTIVKAVYNKISREFDVSCFLADIHYHCGGPNWKVDLPKLVLSCLTQNDNFSIMGYHNDSVTKIRKFIRGRKVLLVLDDVDNFQQLEALGIDPKWFSNGSRIIVTTRDKQSLGDIPYTAYHTMLLNKRESLNLFTRLMFARDDPVNTKFIEELVSHAGGIPLVVKVWSRHFKQYEKEQWPNILETLKKIPHGDIQKQLQMSYDSLPNRSKKLFLDIVCFFDGWEKDFVVKVLLDEDSAFFPDNEIQYLVAKSLVISRKYDDRLLMHRAIREMGQEVVRQENEDEPGQRTRLMGYNVVSVLRDCSGTDAIQCIKLGFEDIEKPVTVQVEAVKKMSDLRFIRLLNNKLSWSSSSSFNTIFFSFKKLKYLEWRYFPFKCINIIDMANVVVIKLHNSKLEILWEGFKNLKKLRILDVSSSRSLIKTGDFTGFEKLEELHFSRCYKLVELHSSICSLGKLDVLDLYKCRKLKRFPWEKIDKLGSQKELDLRYCPHIGLEPIKVMDPLMSSIKEYCCITRLNLAECKILNISDEIGDLKSLKYLNLDGNKFPSLPDSLCQLHELTDIHLSDCPSLKSIPNLPPNIKEVTARNCISLVSLPSNMSELQFLWQLHLDGCLKLEPEALMKISGLRNLGGLYMSNCNVSQVPSEIGNLVSLRSLDLSGNTFSSLPDSFNKLSKLITLMMNDCSRLELLPLLPSKLSCIKAIGCRSLNIFPSNFFQEPFFTREYQIGLSGREILNWFSYKNIGDELSFVAPMHQQLDYKICGVIVYVIIDPDSLYGYQSPTPTLLNKTKETRCRLYSYYIDNCFMYVKFYPFNDTSFVVELGDTIVLQFEQEDGIKVLSCGLHLVYEPTLPIPSDATQDRKVFFVPSEDDEYGFGGDLDDEIATQDSEVFSTPSVDDEYDFDRCLDDEIATQDSSLFWFSSEDDDEYDFFDGNFDDEYYLNDNDNDDDDDDDDDSDSGEIIQKLI